MCLNIGAYSCIYNVDNRWSLEPIIHTWAPQWGGAREHFLHPLYFAHIFLNQNQIFFIVMIAICLSHITVFYKLTDYTSQVNLKNVSIACKALNFLALRSFVFQAKVKLFAHLKMCILKNFLQTPLHSSDFNLAVNPVKK